MSVSNDCSEILQILLHIPDFRPWVMQVVFKSALANQNFKVVKLLLRKLYKELPDVIWNDASLVVKELDVHKNNFTKSINKY
jgi:hypothetical protein